jgi:hypothetical protein
MSVEYWRNDPDGEEMEAVGIKPVRVPLYPVITFM